MRMFLWNYVKPIGACRWQAVSLVTANAYGKGTWLVGCLREWTRAYDDLPLNIYSTWNSSILEDEDFKGELLLHLQGIGKYIRAMDIVNYIRGPDILARLKLKKTISLTTAQCWMKHVGYHWLKTPTGQFVDGHEQSDVVAYRQLTQIYGTDGNECQTQPTTTCQVIVWNHDESTYYANDHQKIWWVHNSETAVPYAKGEGASLMVADMVSPDYGWLQSPDGTEQARVLFKAGKAQDGYFTTQNIINQASNAMDILECHFPDEDHVMVFDNAATHLKCADDALSACKMPKFPPRNRKEWDGSNWSKNGQLTNWGVEVNVVDENGKLDHEPSGEIKKKKVKMCNATFTDGSPQSLYYPEGHQLAGVFKGMATILNEQGHADVSKVQAECPKFQCEKGVEHCCCRRMLFNEPDFVNVKSLLEIACEARGFQAIFFLKFHCELNFIEQCWGYSKWLYHEFPVSSKEVNLKHNVLTVLDSVPLDAIHRFSTQSLRFMDAYCKGLNGKQAAWASKRYRGHRVLPETIMAELETAGLT
ncbi:hypothetical protein BDR04DRAFT_1124254 [Suillus decipiens]|nr:hypothetical protein BDR04DRAFT_1124254 [Suillus decipiens]